MDVPLREKKRKGGRKSLRHRSIEFDPMVTGNDGQEKSKLGRFSWRSKKAALASSDNLRSKIPGSFLSSPVDTRNREPRAPGQRTRNPRASAGRFLHGDELDLPIRAPLDLSWLSRKVLEGFVEECNLKSYDSPSLSNSGGTKKGSRKGSKGKPVTGRASLSAVVRSASHPSIGRGKASGFLERALWSTSTDAHATNDPEDQQQICPVLGAQPGPYYLYVMVMEARGYVNELLQVPFSRVYVSREGEMEISTAEEQSWTPTWNQAFYFRVQSYKLDSVVVRQMRQFRSKDSAGPEEEVGRCRIRLKECLASRYGFFKPYETWHALQKKGAKTGCYLKMAVQLVPEDVKPFQDTSGVETVIDRHAWYAREEFGEKVKKRRKDKAERRKERAKR